MSEQRARILEALARGDGQMLDGFDLGHTAEMMYGKQADAVEDALAEAWAEGYLRGTLDNESDLEPADNPYRL